MSINFLVFLKCWTCVFLTKEKDGVRHSKKGKGTVSVLVLFVLPYPANHSLSGTYFKRRLDLNSGFCGTL